MSNQITLEGRLASDQADALRDELSAASADLTIDGSGVRGIGALCAHELHRARTMRSGSGGAWHINASSEMHADLELLGLSTTLENLGDKK
ncbi:hypothetical protein [Palleronia marisminoris]|uniref:hypothetical protein n=1 Tax=Palleronia marisminoris TaxID=315423 RepID=UPI0011139B42|nr:hypothetical protein [Palleronia marisminoris]